jgi:hypothetical protein
MGWKMIYLARRNPALPPEQFPEAWREHSSLGAGCTNVRDKILSVVQCSRILEGVALRGTADDYDGVNLLSLRDLQAATDIWNDPETLAIMRPDEPRVFSTDVREFTLVCEERVLRDAPRSATCLVGFLRRGAATAAVHWRLLVAQDAAAAAMTGSAFATARRVVHNTVCVPPPAGYEYDSIVEWWFESPGAARGAFGGRDVRDALTGPLGTSADLAGSVFMFTHVTHSRP